MRVDYVKQTFEGLCQISDASDNLGQRREMMLELLLEVLGADFGHWAWGRGDAISNKVMPIALITCGFDESQKSQYLTMGLDPEMDSTFRAPIIEIMANRPQCSVDRAQVFADEIWAKSKMRHYLQLLGGDEWLHSVRYASLDTWSNILLIRAHGKPGFTTEQVQFLDTAMESMGWLHATAAESLLPETFHGITPRQSEVMLMLLDGYPRKVIAARLKIGQETVGAHIKAIYHHFEVNSSSELAALFLRGK